MASPRSHRAECRVGTSGWNYKHWANGRFYPPRLAQRKWLAWYAAHYTTVEINSSFYRIPSPETMQTWATTVPPGFVFAMKLWRGITHYRKLHESGDLLERFFAFASVLPITHRAPLLVQLPPNLAKNVPRLDAFLDELNEWGGKPQWKVAVEFRHPSWLSDDVYRIMDRRDAALTLADMQRCLITEPNDVPIVYIRRHGGHEHGRYTPEQIADDAKRIQRWLKQGKSVYVYYNNDIGGHAVDNAAQLAEALGLPPSQPAATATQGGLFD